MAKSRSRKTQENYTWTAFSRYIRLRDSIRTTGTLSRVICFYCGVELPTFRSGQLNGSQAGHMVSRVFSGAKYNEKVVFASCSHCNGALEGNHVMGFLHLCDMVGFSTAHDIIIDAVTNKIQYDLGELVDIEEACLLACEILEDFYNGQN